ncbi:MAG: hypothetical protein AAGK67_07610 [Pseudomonadota bacterium]
MPIREWFDASRSAAGVTDTSITLDYNAGPAHEAAFVTGAREIIEAEVRLGIDMVAACLHDDQKRLNADLAETIDTKVLALAEAGFQ